MPKGGQDAPETFFGYLHAPLNLCPAFISEADCREVMYC